MKKIHQIIRLIRILADGHNEIVGSYFIDDDMFNTIEVIDADSFCVNRWEQEYEFQVYSDILYEDQLDQLIKQLEQILLN